MHGWMTKYGRSFGVILFIAAGGCLVLNRLGIYRDEGPRFNHAIHFEEAQASCSDCHGEAETSVKAAMPDAAACFECHDADDPKEAAYVGQFEQDGELRWRGDAVLPEEVKFSHKTHAEADLSCETCHVGIEESTEAGPELAVRMPDCMTCHGEREVADSCATCHTKVDKDWAPPSHGRMWKRVHGQVAKAGAEGAMADNCALCHTDAGCAECHQVEAPANHTEFWRMRGHAVAGSFARSDCATCHRTDFCDRCHHDIEPRSHTGLWGSPANRHCVSCHLPLAANPCMTCHKADVGHLSAAPTPVNRQHMEASEADCRTCHSAPPPHVDNGQSCRACHR